MSDDARDQHRHSLATVSNALVRLHARHYGKGPNRARTYMFDDFVHCLLYEPFTTVEQTLIASGQETAVRENRVLFYRTVEPLFRAAVEEITARKTVAFMPQVSVEPAVVSVVFLLEPEG